MNADNHSHRKRRAQCDLRAIRYDGSGWRSAIGTPLRGAMNSNVGPDNFTGLMLRRMGFNISGGAEWILSKGNH